MTSLSMVKFKPQKTTRKTMSIIDEIELRRFGAADEAARRRIKASGQALREAARRGDANLIKKLVSKEGAQVDSPDGELKTPLHWACEYGSPKAVAALLALGANPARHDIFCGANALHWALRGGNPSSCEAVAKASAELLFSKDADGASPLEMAILEDGCQPGSLAAKLAGVAVSKLGLERACEAARAQQLADPFQRALSGFEASEVEKACVPGSAEEKGPARL